MEQFERTTAQFGPDGINKLQKAKIILFGLGGVGGHCFEALVRSGVSFIDVVDNDKIALSNLNRQIVALHSTINKDKVDVAIKRAKDINPNVEINGYKTFFLDEKTSEINLSNYDYIIDCIDTVKAKLELVGCANKYNIPIISSMGTGNKINPCELEVSDIYKTSVCPLARVMRVELKKRGIKKLKVVYSKEKPIKTNNNIPSSNAFVPAVAGLIIASEVIKDIINKNE